MYTRDASFLYTVLDGILVDLGYHPGTHDSKYSPMAFDLLYKSIHSVSDIDFLQGV